MRNVTLSLGVAALAATLLVVSGCNSASQGDSASPSAQMRTLPPPSYPSSVANDAAAKAADKFADSSTPASPGAGAAASYAPGFVHAANTHREADLAVKVGDVEKIDKQVSKYVDDIGGFIQSSSFSNTVGAPPTDVMTIEVPQPVFADAVENISTMGSVTSKSIVADDLTAQLTDIQHQIKEVQKQKDGSMAAALDNLNLEKKQLLTQARFSEIRLTLTKDMALSPNTNDSRWTQEQWTFATSAFGNMASLIGTAGIWMLVMSPFWLTPLLIGYVLYRHFARRRPQDLSRVHPPVA